MRLFMFSGEEGKMQKLAFVSAAAGLLFGAGAALAQNADTVDLLHASKTPVRNRLLALDSSEHFPSSVWEVPFALKGNTSGGVFRGFNSSSLDGSSGVCGYSFAASGSTRGVVGASDSTSGRGVYGLVTAVSGTTYGVYGTSWSTSGRGVYGEATATSGWTYGVFGNAIASSDGTGVYGWGSEYGVYGSAGASGYGVYSYGDMYVNGDLIASGSKGGYVTDVVLNGGDEPLVSGDLVEIVWHSEPVVGENPVPVVQKTDSASSQAVLGPIDRAVRITEGERSTVPGRPDGSAPSREVHAATEAIEPGGYGQVVTLGCFVRIKVDAGYGPIYPGDLLVSSPTPGHAMVCDDPQVGTVVGKALGALESGAGEIPIFVSPR